MKGKAPWNKGKPYHWFWGDREDKPNQKEWMILNSTGVHIIKNIKRWCINNGYSYQKVKTKLRYNSFPYKDIEKVRKFGDK